MATDRTGLIHFRCTAEAHQQAVSGRTPDTLTVHQGRWAWCPMDVAAKDHEWEATGGVAIESLRRAAPTISLDAKVPQRAGSAAAPRDDGRVAAPKAPSRKRPAS